jgi:cytochrome b561
MLTISLPSTAALYHQFVLHDGLLGRMGLGRKGWP